MPPMPKIPELKFTSNKENNWPEVERFLYCNSAVFNKSYHEAEYMGMSGDIWKLRLAVYYLASQNCELKEIAIKQAENAVVQYIIPKNQFKRPSLFKRIIYLIKSGEWM